ncbi:uncharacterized protein IUM83_12824 [Phytophthora cinnamomi]|uniref:uncharacterized protein n=1 Tax=Phytophthora cinnamomi TaxID=4785 RepID=UPI003559BCB7|nr:hypothetical protein IUM83_12824 [Phytophthora cinnamomi]
MVKPRGKILRDCEVTARDLSFKSVWRELKAQGWTRKSPPRRSLDDRYYYIRPGCELSEKEGVHFFRGEGAVLEYYANVLRNTARVPTPAARGAPGDAQRAAAAEVVRLNYSAEIEAAPSREQVPAARARASASARVPTSPQVAVIPVEAAQAAAEAPQGAGQAVADRDGSTAAEATPSAPPATPPTSVRGGAPGKRAARRSARRSLDAASGALPRTPTRACRTTTTELIATSPHGGDSYGDTASPADTRDEEKDDDADEAEVTARGTALLSDNDDDLNAIETNISGQFGSIESGDEAEKDDVETGEYESDEDVAAWCLPGDVTDDPEETEAEIAAEVLFAENFLESFGSEDQVLAGNLKNPVLRSMTATGWEDVVEPDVHQHMMAPYEPVDDVGSYPGLRQSYSGPMAEALRHGDSPVALFFYFLPVVLWQHIAACSNEYHREMLPHRIHESYQRYRKKQRRNAHLPRKTRHDIQHDMETMKPIMPHELCRFIGLLVARTISPNREKLANHWKTTDVGAISRGSFGSVLSRDRFMEISRNLHFNSNSDARAQTDRAWKIRKSFILQQDASLHEGQAAQLGTKLFMLCSAVTAYCIR